MAELGIGFSIVVAPGVQFDKEVVMEAAEATMAGIDVVKVAV